MSQAVLQPRRRHRHPWTEWSPLTSADSHSASPPLGGVTWQQTLKHSGERRSHQLNTWRTRRRVTSWSDICCHSHDIYHIIQAQKSINIRGEKLVKTVLPQVCRILSFWHQEHLALASSALLVLTSNGLLRALQGDYLCTISESLWSLCDNGILSWLPLQCRWVPWAVAFPRGACAIEI